MVKTYVPDQWLEKCFVKYILASITEDVAKGGVVTELKFIAHDEYLDMVGTQSGTLYDKISNNLSPLNIVPPPPSK